MLKTGFQAMRSTFPLNPERILEGDSTAQQLDFFFFLNSSDSC